MLRQVSKFFSDLFATPEPVRGFDTELGEIEYRINDSDDWVIRRLMNGAEIEIHLEGTETEINPQAKEYYFLVKPRLPELWEAAMRVTIEFSSPYGFVPRPSDFRLEAVHINPVEMFENGQLYFSFNVDGDPDGSYFVPFRDGIPLLVHRDS